MDNAINPHSCVSRLYYPLRCKTLNGSDYWHPKFGIPIVGYLSNGDFGRKEKQETSTRP